MNGKEKRFIESPVLKEEIYQAADEIAFQAKSMKAEASLIRSDIYYLDFKIARIRLMIEEIERIVNTERGEVIE